MLSDEDRPDARSAPLPSACFYLQLIDILNFLTSMLYTATTEIAF